MPALNEFPDVIGSQGRFTWVLWSGTHDFTNAQVTLRVPIVGNVRRIFPNFVRSLSFQPSGGQGATGICYLSKLLHPNAPAALDANHQSWFHLAGGTNVQDDWSSAVYGQAVSGGVMQALGRSGQRHDDYPVALFDHVHLAHSPGDMTQGVWADFGWVFEYNTPEEARAALTHLQGWGALETIVSRPTAYSNEIGLITDPANAGDGSRDSFTDVEITGRILSSIDYSGFAAIHDDQWRDTLALGVRGQFYGLSQGTQTLLIRLSVDGGSTFPHTLGGGSPGSGHFDEETVQFYDINAIVGATPGSQLAVQIEYDGSGATGSPNDLRGFELYQVEIVSEGRPEPAIT